MKEKTFVIARETIKTYNRTGHKMFNIVGEKGVGKTTYALKIMYQIYRASGMGEQESWQRAIDNLIFKKEDMIKFIKKYKGDQQPVVCWDDMRAHASGMTYLLEPGDTTLLLGLMDTMRTSVAGLLTTSPSLRSVLKFISASDGYTVKLKYDKIYQMRYALGYKRNETITGKIFLKYVFRDEMHWLLPDWVFVEINRKREAYGSWLIKRWEQKKKHYPKNKNIQKEIDVIGRK